MRKKHEIKHLCFSCKARQRSSPVPVTSSLHHWEVQFPKSYFYWHTRRKFARFERWSWNIMKLKTIIKVILIVNYDVLQIAAWLLHKAEISIVFLFKIEFVEIFILNRGCPSKRRLRLQNFVDEIHPVTISLWKWKWNDDLLHDTKIQDRET